VLRRGDVSTPLPTPATWLELSVAGVAVLAYYVSVLLPDPGKDSEASPYKKVTAWQSRQRLKW
jgi:hypothetical protein